MKPGRRNSIFLTALFLISMSALIWGFPRIPTAVVGRGLATGRSHSSSKHLGSTPASTTVQKAISTIQEAISANHVMIFSKTYCPYCTRAKDALKGLNAKGMEVYELDMRKDGGDLQTALLQLTGQRTVPNIFIGGKHVGGCDTTLAKIADGSLQKMLK